MSRDPSDPFPSDPPASRASVEEAQTEKPIDVPAIVRELVAAAEEANDALCKALHNAALPTRTEDLMRSAHARLWHACAAARLIGGSKVHRLKSDPGPFRQVWAGMKPFEVRKFDRDYRVGDELKLSEFDREARAYSGAWISARIISILRPGEYDLPQDVGVLGIEVIDKGGDA